MFADKVELKRYFNKMDKDKREYIDVLSGEKVYVITTENLKSRIDKPNIQCVPITETISDTPEDLFKVKTFIFFGKNKLRKNSKEFKILNDLCVSIFGNNPDIGETERVGYYFLNKYHYDPDIINNNLDTILEIINNFNDVDNIDLYLSLIHGVQSGEFRFVKNIKSSPLEFFKRWPPKNTKTQLFCGLQNQAELTNLMRFAGNKKQIFILRPYDDELVHKEDGLFFVDVSAYQNDDVPNKIVSIDTFFMNHGCNLIKINNNYELPTLFGGIQTLIRTQPTLIIDLKLKDLIKIPAFLVKLNINYKFYLSYYDATNDLNNITLYAMV